MAAVAYISVWIVHPSGVRTGMGFQPDGLLALGSTSIWKSFVVSDKFTRKPNICRATGVIKEDIFQGDQ